MVTLAELRDNSLALNKVRAVTENKDEFDTSWDLDIKQIKDTHVFQSMFWNFLT